MVVVVVTFLALTLNIQQGLGGREIGPWVGLSKIRDSAPAQPLPSHPSQPALYLPISRFQYAPVRLKIMGPFPLSLSVSTASLFVLFMFLAMF